MRILLVPGGQFCCFGQQTAWPAGAHQYRLCGAVTPENANQAACAVAFGDVHPLLGDRPSQWLIQMPGSAEALCQVGSSNAAAARTPSLGGGQQRRCDGHGAGRRVGELAEAIASGALLLLVHLRHQHGLVLKFIGSFAARLVQVRFQALPHAFIHRMALELLLYSGRLLLFHASLDLVVQRVPHPVPLPFAGHLALAIMHVHPHLMVLLVAVLSSGLLVVLLLLLGARGRREMLVTCFLRRHRVLHPLLLGQEAVLLLIERVVHRPPEL
mmetsp:Transcript_57287/g.174437  ORF Transcript_57287/g.174437 Transcript_57287/m.174437 type:complete len:270 (+) Transcript_57287:275-1084(+)